CHVRDPRDVLTSYYFSAMYSHDQNPQVQQLAQRYAALGIDAAVLDAAKLFLPRYLEYVALHKRWGFPILTYETLVTDYPRWLDGFLQVFGSVPEQVRHSFIEEYTASFKVTAENVYSHVRQITPGDHKKKLSPETIAKLNDLF